MDGVAVTSMRLALDLHSLTEGLYFFTDSTTHSFMSLFHKPALVDAFSVPDLVFSPGDVSVTKMPAA